MYATDTILTFGFPVGRLGGSRFRISFLFPVTALAIIWRLGSVQYGLLASGLLLFSAVLHELAHLVVARSTGGEMDEVHLWPLGGLEEPYGRGYWQDHVQTMLAGPLTNLLLAVSCLLTLPLPEAASLLNPLVMFTIPVGEALATTVCRMAFLINVMMFAINIIPVTPFDGGVLLRTYLTSRFADVEGRDLMVRLGLVFGLMGIVVGFVVDSSVVVALSSFVLLLHLHENMRWYESVESQDEFADYDFGDSGSDEFSDSLGLREGYFGADADSTGSHAEVLERWRNQREQEQRDSELEERQREEEQVDRILQKIHVHGRESLSNNDLHLLNRVSHRLRDRQQHS